MNSGQNRQPTEPGMRLALAGALVSGTILVLCALNYLQPDQPGVGRLDRSALRAGGLPAANAAPCTPCHFR